MSDCGRDSPIERDVTVEVDPVAGDGGEDYSSGDEEAGDEEDTDVLLGFAEPAEDPRSLLRHRFPSKVGGTPAWMDPADLPRGEAASCGTCGKPLEFLLQVYCPVELQGREDTFHRAVFVFTCRDGACLAGGGGARAFRCQLPRANALYGADPAGEGDHEPPAPPGGQPPLCDWCGVWRADKRCGQCKGPMYCSRQHQTEHWKKGGHKAVCKGLEAEGAPPPYPHHPEKHLEVEPEPEEGEGGEGDESMEARALRAMKARQEVEGEVPDEEISDVVNLELTEEKRQWASFQTRAALAPEQVLRYDRGGREGPLWPSTKKQAGPGDIPPCGRCGGARAFEFQVMPQLLSYLDVDSEDPSGIDWSTLVVYSCQGSCSAPEVEVQEATVGKVSSAYCEEFVWVQPAYHDV